MMIIIALSPWPSQRTSSVLMLLINLRDILANEADCQSDVPPADWEAEAASKVTELPQGEINKQPSRWATNSLSAAEALKSVGKRLLLLSLEDYCSVTRKKKLPLESQNFLCWVIFQCFWVCIISLPLGVPTPEGLEWFNIFLGEFFFPSDDDIFPL